MQQQEEHQLANRSDSTLYDRHAAIILAYARSHTASWQDAEDLTLEVFLTALQHDSLSWLSDKQQLVWLWRVAHNKLVDSYRRPDQPPTVPLEQVVENACRDEALTPEQLVLRREELETLFQAVGKLSLEQQQILHLRFGEGLRFAEIAVLLNKREATVRKICSRSLALLHSTYDQQEKGTRS
jgi:RNA polymerase sigma factor (sigma-70 family)